MERRQNPTQRGYTKNKKQMRRGETHKTSHKRGLHIQIFENNGKRPTTEVLVDSRERERERYKLGAEKESKQEDGVLPSWTASFLAFQIAWDINKITPPMMHQEFGKQVATLIGSGSTVLEQSLSKNGRLRL